MEVKLTKKKGGLITHVRHDENNVEFSLLN